MRAIERRGYSLLQSGEEGNEVVSAERGQGALDIAVCGNDEPQLATFCQNALACCYQGLDCGRVAEPGAGHVHHERPVLLRRRQQDGA